jgi:uncharacterized membrane protein
MSRVDKETSRLEAFSDGVFAIAITLLVLELKVPHAAADGESSAPALGGRLLREWPSYLALVTSFFTILIIWVHHHILFKLVRKVDAKLLFANGFLLLLVSVVPFPTAVVAEYLATPAAPAACEFYADVFVLISIAFYILMTAAVRESVCDSQVPPARIRRLRRNYGLGPPLYFVAAVAAPFSPMLAMAVFTALWVFWAMTTGEC